MTVNNEEFLRYYWEELIYLRRLGTSFARSYPKIAGRLELEPDETPDPHVERLIESFAFLTARIQSSLDADFPQIASELLGILYPHFLAPVPSFSIVRFELDPERKLTTGYEVPRDTRLFAKPEGEETACHFRTGHPVTLWPVTVEDADFPPVAEYPQLADTAAAILRLRLRATDDAFDLLQIPSLRFYLNVENVAAAMLYDTLFSTVAGIAVGNPGDAVEMLSPDSLRPVGFDDDDALLPYPAHAQPAYRTLQEYFVFPEKFQFFDLVLGGRGSGKELDVLFVLDDAPASRAGVDASTFALGCTPVVNLFSRTSEPLRIDHRRLEYRLIADQRREKTTEIHSIIAVSGTADPRDATRRYQPFYAYQHDLSEREQRVFWSAKRVLSLYHGVRGTEMLLSFLDLDFKPAHPPDEVFYAHTLCTNRGLAEQVPGGALFHSDEAIPAARIVCLRKPTPQLSPPLGGETLWRLVSHLSLNYLSLAAEKRGCEALREMLRLYTYSEAESIQHQINGIRTLEPGRVVRRIGEDAWRGHCRGVSVDITLDENLYVGSSAILFASVLNHFFAMYAPVNSFTELRLRSQQREGVWKQWPPMAGSRPLL